MRTADSIEELSPKRKRFVAEYLIDCNATKAAERAGYAAGSADVTGARLLGNASVAKAIAAGQSRLAAKLEISAERVLQELARLAYFDIRRLFNPDGSMKSISELDDDTALAIQAVDHEKLFEYYAKGQRQQIGNTVKVKMADKGQNLERLGRHLKLFTDKIELSGDEMLMERLAAGRKRLNANSSS